MPIINHILLFIIIALAIASKSSLAEAQQSKDKQSKSPILVVGPDSTLDDSGDTDEMQSVAFAKGGKEKDKKKNNGKKNTKKEKKDKKGDKKGGKNSATLRKASVYSRFKKSPAKPFFAFGPKFDGGIRVALGDVNADGIPEVITGPGAGGASLIKLFNPQNGRPASLPHSEFNAFSSESTEGIFVAVGSVSPGHGVSIIAGGGGEPRVVVIHPLENRELTSFLAYDASFKGGVRVAAGDVNGDGLDEIITGPGAGTPPIVRVFNAPNNRALASFPAYDSSFTGGVFVATGDVNGDGTVDIVTGPGATPSGSAGGGPHVKVFNGSGTQLLEIFPYETSFQGGVRVATGDVNGDGVDDIITGAGPGRAADVRAFNGTTGEQIGSFTAFPNSYKGGVFVGGN